MFTIGVICKTKSEVVPRIFFGINVKLSSEKELEFTIFDDACTWLECRLIYLPRVGVCVGLALFGYGANLTLCNGSAVDNISNGTD